MVTQMPPVELAAVQDADEPMSRVDTRRPKSVDGCHRHEATNVPFDPREGFDDALEPVLGGRRRGYGHRHLRRGAWFGAVGDARSRHDPIGTALLAL